jgi:hypothetical protein
MYKPADFDSQLSNADIRLTTERQKELQRLLDTLMVEIEAEEPGEIPDSLTPILDSPLEPGAYTGRGRQNQIRLEQVAKMLHPVAIRDASPATRKPTSRTVEQEPIYPTVVLNVQINSGNVLYTLPHVRPKVSNYLLFKFWATVSHIIQHRRGKDEPRTPENLRAAECYWITRLTGSDEPSTDWRMKHSVRTEHLRIDGPSEIIKIYAFEPKVQ